MRKTISTLAWLTGLPALSRRVLTRSARFVLNFHGVSSQRRPDVPRQAQPHHSAAEFRQTLAWLGRRFHFLTAAEFFQTNQPGVLLTFDDGHANNLTQILPLLAEFQAQGVFFVTTQHVHAPVDWLSFTREYARLGFGGEANVPSEIAEDWYAGLDPAQLGELARSPWAVVGSHTDSHPSLPGCDDQRLRAELVSSRRYLQELSSQPVDLLAYPYGEYDQRVAEAVRDAGYTAAFAVKPVGLPASLRRYEIPRVDLYFSDAPYLSLKLSGLFRRATFQPFDR